MEVEKTGFTPEELYEYHRELRQLVFGSVQAKITLNTAYELDLLKGGEYSTRGGEADQVIAQANRLISSTIVDLNRLSTVDLLDHYSQAYKPEWFTMLQDDKLDRLTIEACVREEEFNQAGNEDRDNPYSEIRHQLQQERDRRVVEA